MRAIVLGHLGDASEAAGDRSAARGAWGRALTLLDQLNDPSAAVMRSRLGGHPAGRV
jgi:hypothetical protein